MNADWTFLVGLFATVALCAAAVTYLRAPLRTILIDLCGNESRAGFWVAFSNIVLLSVPSIFSLRAHPSQDMPAGAIFAIGDQIESGLIGLAISTVVLGLVLSRFIARARMESK